MKKLIPLILILAAAAGCKKDSPTPPAVETVLISAFDMTPTSEDTTKVQFRRSENVARIWGSGPASLDGVTYGFPDSLKGQVALWIKAAAANSGSMPLPEARITVKDSTGVFFTTITIGLGMNDYWVKDFYNVETISVRLANDSTAGKYTDEKGRTKYKHDVNVDFAGLRVDMQK